VNSEYVQNLRYKLQKRVRRLNSHHHDFFHMGLKHFWGFLATHSVFQGVLDDLESRQVTARGVADQVLGSPQTQVGSSELEHAAISYLVLRHCATIGDSQLPWQIGHRYKRDGGVAGAVEAFRDLFLEPFYEYLDEQLDEQRAILALLRRYKHKCEWFARDDLFKMWESDTQWGERNLAKHLYEYLHDQGIDFHIEPQSASGEADLIAMQKTDDPLVADAKIFDPDRSKGKSYIAKGFGQVYRYTVDFTEPFGYLIVYLTGKQDLRFALKQKTLSTPFVVHNNKTIFLLTIDIFPHAESASKRGGLTPQEITEEDLIQVVDAMASSVVMPA
jgi:hypothetical protein